MRQIPDTIVLKGHGVTRTVWVDEDCLPNSSSYNWGYSRGDSPYNLAKDILALFFEPEIILRYVTAFKNSVVAFIPNENFTIKIHLKKWVQTYERELPPCSAFDFIEIGLSKDLFIPKYLDFPNLPIATGNYANNTLENKLLKNLSQMEMVTFEDYVKNRTLRQEGFGDNKKDVWATIHYSEPEDAFKYRDGLGLQHSTGTPTA